MKQALEGLEEVRKVEVNLEKGTANVAYDGKAINESAARSAFLKTVTFKPIRKALGKLGKVPP